MIHRIQLTANKHGKANMEYEGVVIGISNEPLFDAARILLNSGKADAEHVIETYRGKTRCMSAKVGLASKLTVRETDAGDGPRFVTWKASPYALATCRYRQALEGAPYHSG